MASSILFLCTGNTCRSPVAEAVARWMFRSAGVEFGSAGLDARPGQPVSPESAAWCLRAGVPLDGHRSRAVTASLLVEAVWVIGMTRSHAAVFRSRFGGVYRGAVGVLGAPGVDLTLRANSPDVEEVKDPYGGTTQDYQAVCGRIKHLVAHWEPYFAVPETRKDDRK